MSKSKDPAFLFYPGDYLRDTQCLSELTQVAYDRIMCEHMRNICITKSQLKFFTKKLNDDQIQELKYVLDEVEGGFQIGWVAESINKRRDYSESRRRNRSKKKEEDMNNICSTYDEYMENENENENEIVNGGENSNIKLPEKKEKEEAQSISIRENYEIASIKERMDEARGIKHSIMKRGSQDYNWAKARLEEYGFEKVMEVVQFKAKEWSNTDNAKYIRPSTLLRRSNFEKYIEEIQVNGRDKKDNRTAKQIWEDSQRLFNV